MTPKEQYEARKAARKAEWGSFEGEAQTLRANGRGRLDYDGEKQMLAVIDMIDRLATAAERIADALERAR